MKKSDGEIAASRSPSFRFSTLTGRHRGDGGVELGTLSRSIGSLERDKADGKQRAEQELFSTPKERERESPSKRKRRKVVREGSERR